jgi:cell division protein FtsB
LQSQRVSSALGGNSSTSNEVDKKNKEIADLKRQLEKMQVNEKKKEEEIK